MSQYFEANAGALANAVLAIHAALAAFVVFGLVLIAVGAVCRARWVRNLWFRATHLGLMMYIAGETAFGLTCPLTRLEQVLRQGAGQPVYSESFLEHLIRPMLFFDASPWVFVMLHSIAAIVVVATWVLVPRIWPRRAVEALRGGDAAQF